MMERKLRYKRKLLQDADITSMTSSLRSRVAKLSDKPVCDFCGSEYPMWAYASSRMSTGEHVECWRWTACYECGVYIMVNNWSALKLRILKALTRIGKVLGISDVIVRNAVDKSLQEFFNYAVQETEDET